MFSKIMIPVDLAHQPDLAKALDCAGDLARHYGATVVYVGVTASTPGALGHNPAEYEQRLAAFAEAQGKAQGIAATEMTVVSHDPAIDLDAALAKAVRETGADLVVMASHIPNLADHLWPSHGGSLAAEAGCSVMLVRS